MGERANQRRTVYARCDSTAIDAKHDSPALFYGDRMKSDCSAVIELDVFTGAVLDETLIYACALALNKKLNVRFVFNGTEYFIDWTRVQVIIEDNHLVVENNETKTEETQK